MQAISYKNDQFNITEPFKGLFTQGMVCHETYKDQKNNWVNPDDVFIKDGEKFLKNESNQKVIIGASESMSKSKKKYHRPRKNY